VAQALEGIFDDRINGGVVSVRDPGLSTLNNIEVIHASHPLPSRRSVEAAKKILSTAHNAGPDDLVLACFTGGSSALASMPPQGVSEADKRTLHELLLSSGLAIGDINCVRKSVSDVKGGRVALAAAPATVVNLTVSDVAGSPLDAVTDPTVQDSSTASLAITVLKDAGLWDVVPESVRAHLLSGYPTPTLDREPQTVMLADGASTVAAMADAAKRLHHRAVVVAEEVEGDAREVGQGLSRRLLSAVAKGGSDPVMLLGCGGESVVSISSPDAFSRGGPNQHAALCSATVLHRHRAAALFMDTDGSDGGTDLAGGLVDGFTLDLAEKRGVNIESGLALQRSTEVCRALDAAVMTGHTGTNVNDLFVLVAESGEQT
jgi:glycerate-2-kinase